LEFFLDAKRENVIPISHFRPRHPCLSSELFSNGHDIPIELIEAVFHDTMICDNVG
jgi:hypothetical protein